MTIQKTAIDKLQQLSDDTGQPLEEVISGALLWGLKMIKENPEMADDFRKRIAASKKKDSSGG
ncbi:hypothetical protein [Pseudomonas sp.]|uniref:hypothetical protein n=1 Tax=Pseudomonas sp. TaxID=306 RepID=UPI0028B1898F|nr:hypothetical protein [Pseudomonas sp.]